MHHISAFKLNREIYTGSDVIFAFIGEKSVMVDVRIDVARFVINFISHVLINVEAENILGKYLLSISNLRLYCSVCQICLWVARIRVRNGKACFVLKSHEEF